jgi:cysteine-S-conjugate beta-lyase
MGVRLKVQGEATLAIARWLLGRPEIGQVLHPALPDFPDHALYARDFAGPGTIFSFALAGGSIAQRTAFIEALTLFGLGYSWGCYESLVTPVDLGGTRTATNRQFAGPLVRLQIGLEHADDLIADLETGLAAWRAAAA